MDDKVVERYRQQRQKRLDAKKEESQRCIDAYRARRDARIAARQRRDEEGDVDQWITVNGASIPVMQGETKTTAVEGFIAEKQGQSGMGSAVPIGGGRIVY